MDTSRRRFTRLAIVAATAAGVALASPVVAVADDSEVVETAPIDENSDQPVAEVPTTETLVIELIVEGTPPPEAPDGQPEEATEDAAEEVAEDVGATMATDAEPVEADPSPMVAALEGGSGGEHEGGSGGEHEGGSGGEHEGGSGGEHEGGSGGEHEGGSGGEHEGGGGTGDPYRMTFEVSWQLPDKSVIEVLDDELPADWREMFDLAAASATGGGKPTSARCTYPSDASVSADLVCEFENPGKHSSVTDGMVVPRKPTATYSVTVPWPTSGWTIEGANDGPYSARDVCSGGGHGEGGGHDGGHDSGHGETTDVAALEAGESPVCIHTVVIRRVLLPTPPPEEPPAAEVPAPEAPPSQTPVQPEVAPTPPAVEVLPATAAPRALPATGNTATTTLMIGAIILALGGSLSVLARRRNDLPLS